jgi:hypothetical protein
MCVCVCVCVCVRERERERERERVFARMDGMETLVSSVWWQMLVIRGKCRRYSFSSSVNFLHRQVKTACFAYTS